MTEKLDTIIIGAGIVGAGVAYALRHRADRCFVVERETRLGTGISSRNSGVIHAGLYYPRHSLKTELCRRGATLLYAFAKKQGVPFRKTGKYIVARTEDECCYLDELVRQNEHEVPLQAVATLPNGITALKAVFSPNTGIVDIHQLLEALVDLSGVPVLFNHEVQKIQATEHGVQLRIAGEDYCAERVVNCGGLTATEFAGDHHHRFAKGSYFQVKIPSGLDVPHLVYPAVPKGSPGLGIHLTRNLHGEAYLGPDVEWVDCEDYSVDPERARLFFMGAKGYLPWLEPQHLQPGYAGLRPKLAGRQFADFLLTSQDPWHRVIHCLGIESPGLTAAMAIGERVATMLEA